MGEGRERANNNIISGAAGSSGLWLELEGRRRVKERGRVFGMGRAEVKVRGTQQQNAGRRTQVALGGGLLGGRAQAGRWSCVLMCQQKSGAWSRQTTVVRWRRPGELSPRGTGTSRSAVPRRRPSTDHGNGEPCIDYLLPCTSTQESPILQPMRRQAQHRRRRTQQ